MTCLNGGVCDDGTCICGDGFEGDDCGTAKIAKFLGSFSVDGSCTRNGDPQNTSISCDITEDPAVENGIIFSNFIRGVTLAAGETHRVQTAFTQRIVVGTVLTLYICYSLFYI